MIRYISDIANKMDNHDEEIDHSMLLTNVSDMRYNSAMALISMKNDAMADDMLQEFDDLESHNTNNKFSLDNPLDKSLDKSGFTDVESPSKDDEEIRLRVQNAVNDYLSSSDSETALIMSLKEWYAKLSTDLDIDITANAALKSLVKSIITDAAEIHASQADATVMDNIFGNDDIFDDDNNISPQFDKLELQSTSKVENMSDLSGLSDLSDIDDDFAIAPNRRERKKNKKEKKDKKKKKSKKNKSLKSSDDKSYGSLSEDDMDSVIAEARKQKQPPKKRLDREEQAQKAAENIVQQEIEVMHSNGKMISF